MNHHIKEIEKWAVLYGESKEQNYHDLMGIAKDALNETLRLQDEALYALSIKGTRQLQALEEIQKITKDIKDSNDIYEKLYNVACRGLGMKRGHYIGSSN